MKWRCSVVIILEHPFLSQPSATYAHHRLFFSAARERCAIWQAGLAAAHRCGTPPERSPERRQGSRPQARDDDADHQVLDDFLALFPNPADVVTWRVLDFSLTVGGCARLIGSQTAGRCWRRRNAVGNAFGVLFYC